MYTLQGFWIFICDVFRASWLDHPLSHRDIRTVILRQIFFTGMQAFQLIAAAAVIFGIVTVAQSGAQLSRIGGSAVIGDIVVGAFFRDLGPLLTIVVVTARSVSAIASELSSMKANGEIDGLRSMGVSPLSYLVIPRVLGGAISTFLLAIHFVWIALFIGFFICQFYIHIPWTRYIDGIVASLAPLDVLIFFIKTFGVGMMVFLVAAYCGLRTSGASFEIPQATTKAVVWSFGVCFGIQISISLIYYIILLSRSGLLGVL